MNLFDIHKVNFIRRTAHHILKFAKHLLFFHEKKRSFDEHTRVGIFAIFSRRSISASTSCGWSTKALKKHLWLMDQRREGLGSNFISWWRTIFPRSLRGMRPVNRTPPRSRSSSTTRSVASNQIHFSFHVPLTIKIMWLSARHSARHGPLKATSAMKHKTSVRVRRDTHRRWNGWSPRPSSIGRPWRRRRRWAARRRRRAVGRRRRRPRRPDESAGASRCWWAPPGAPVSG